MTGEMSGGSYETARSYVDEAAWRALAQELIGLAKWRGIDETQAQQLADIPGAEIQGPMTCRELVELLGGFDDRPEWAEAKALIRNTDN